MAYREERDKEILEHQRKLEEERLKDDIIRREKERLLREHMPHIAEFLPKGVVKPEEIGYYTSSQGGFQGGYNSYSK